MRFPVKKQRPERFRSGRRAIPESIRRFNSIAHNPMLTNIKQYAITKLHMLRLKPMEIDVWRSNTTHMSIRKSKCRVTIPAVIFVVISVLFLSSCGGGQELPLSGRVISVEVDDVPHPSQYTATAEVTRRPKITIFSLFQKRLPDIITFDATNFYNDHVDLKPGDCFRGVYLIRSIDGNTARVVSIIVLD